MCAVGSCYKLLKGMSSGYLNHQPNALQLNFEWLWNGSHVLWQTVSKWTLWRSPIFLLPLERNQDHWKQFVFFLKKWDEIIKSISNLRPITCTLSQFLKIFVHQCIVHGKGFLMHTLWCIYKNCSGKCFATERYSFSWLPFGIPYK